MSLSFDEAMAQVMQGRTPTLDSLRLANTFRLQREHQAATRHLRAILNEASTATQTWQAQQEARQWLASLDADFPYPIQFAPL